MDAVRRALLSAAALGASGLALQAAFGADESDKGKPGEGGYGRDSVQLPPGAKVATHDSKDIEARAKGWPAFTCSSTPARRASCIGTPSQPNGPSSLRADARPGHGHAIQTIGDKPCHFILSFDNVPHLTIIASRARTAIHNSAIVRFP
jgi:oxalate decarboxylase